MIWFLALAAIAIALLLCVLQYAKRKHLNIWLPGYLKRKQTRIASDLGEPIDIMFLFVDHFELNGKDDRREAWEERYPALGSRHADADGKPPQHTWFYAIDLMHEHELEMLKDFTDRGLGEVELHWHHSHQSVEEYLIDLRAGLATLQKYGFVQPWRPDQTACFGFIHGNWSLDNACGAKFCGIDNEIELLLAEGCYADFTFPAMFNKAQPRVPNTIFYASDDGKAKSYDVGRPSSVGIDTSAGDLQIFQGPLAVNWKDWRFVWHPALEDGDINRSRSHNLQARIDCWVDQKVHVEGQPNWWFVKVFCHGAQDHEAVLGDESDDMFRYLEERYNDGKRFRLHYVTAREAFNIVKAAEAGKTGNPNQFRDFLIPHPAHRAQVAA